MVWSNVMCKNIIWIKLEIFFGDASPILNFGHHFSLEIPKIYTYIL